jgi:hypothetical protein
VAYTYYEPIPIDVDDDGVDEVILQAGTLPARCISHDLATTLWASAENDLPLQPGAISTCQGAPPRLVEGSLVHPARLKITTLSGPKAGNATTQVLAGGKRFADESQALAAGATPGQLGPVSVEANLTGQGRPSAVVGSTDGWLYAVNPCSGDLDFSLNLGAPVGESIFADTDGDGLDEILVTTGDGYLNDVRHRVMNAPTFVWDIDAIHGVVDHDIDEIETTDSLAGRWSSVSSSTGYEVAVTDDAENIITNPPWKAVGAVNQTTLSGLSLADGARYSFVVRSLNSSGHSVDQVSNGVTVHFPPVLDSGLEAASDSPSDSTSTSDASDDSIGPSTSDVILSGRACTCRSTPVRSPTNPHGVVAQAGVILLAAILRRRRDVRRGAAESEKRMK